MNWAPGKSESLIKYRGENSCAARETLRNDKGDLSLPIPRSIERLRIVDAYKHLGTYISIDGNTIRNTIYRVRSAMEAYAPLAFKLFGNTKIGTPHRFAFHISLVVSRPTFNTHIVVLKPNDLCKMSAAYMRGLRQIGGDTDSQLPRSIAILRCGCCSTHLPLIVYLCVLVFGI